MNKLQINFTDGLRLLNKIPVGTDKNGSTISICDTVVRDDGEKFVIGYRYGSISLIPFFGMHTLGFHEDTKSLDRYTKCENEVSVVQGKFLIIGYDNEAFFKENAAHLDCVEISNIIPQ